MKLEEIKTSSDLAYRDRQRAGLCTLCTMVACLLPLVMPQLSIIGKDAVDFTAKELLANSVRGK